jgi:hypothetical protein
MSSDVAVTFLPKKYVGLHETNNVSFDHVSPNENPNDVATSDSILSGPSLGEIPIVTPANKQ